MGNRYREKKEAVDEWLEGLIAHIGFDGFLEAVATHLLEEDLEEIERLMKYEL